MQDVHIVHDEYGGEMELFSLHEPEWTQRGAGHPGVAAADWQKQVDTAHHWLFNYIYF